MRSAVRSFDSSQTMQNDHREMQPDQTLLPSDFFQPVETLVPAKKQSGTNPCKIKCHFGFYTD